MKFWSSNTAGANRTSLYAKMLCEQGYKVTFSSFLEYHRDYSFVAGVENNNCYLVGSSHTLEASLSFYNQFPLLISYFAALKKIGRKSELAFILYPSKDFLFDFMVLFFLRILSRYHVFYEMNEVRKYSYSRKKLKGFFKYYMNALNEKFLFLYSGVFCISSRMVKYVAKFNRNLIQIPILTSIENNKPFIPDYSITDVFKIGFAGTIDVNKENLEIFLQALQILVQRGKRIEFNLYGRFNSNSGSRLKELTHKYNLEEVVHYRGNISHDKLIGSLRENHLLVLPRIATKQNDYGFSTKLSDYLVSCIPVLLTDVSDNLMYIQDGYNGLVADPSNVFSFFNKINEIIDNYEKLATGLGKNAIETAKDHFNYRLFSKQFSCFLEKQFLSA